MDAKTITAIYTYLLDNACNNRNIKRDFSLAFEISHMSSTMQFCILEARRRKLNDDIAAVIGLIHDVYRLFTGEHKDHALKSGKYVREILDRFTSFTEEEKGIIIKAIENHSKKAEIGSDYEELIKDVDVYDSYLYGVTKDDPAYDKRLNRMREIYGG